MDARAPDTHKSYTPAQRGSGLMSASGLGGVLARLDYGWQLPEKAEQVGNCRDSLPTYEGR